MSLENFLRWHVLAAIDTYELAGNLTPKLWASEVDTHTFAVAEPATQDGLTLAVDDRTELLDLLCRAVDADYIGRIDEAFIRWQEDEDRLDGFRPGELATRVDFDPKVRTAIIGQAYDWVLDKYAGHIAIAELDDEGNPIWVHAPLREPHDDTAMILTAAGILASSRLDPECERALEELDDFASNAGWHIAIGQSTGHPE